MSDNYSLKEVRIALEGGVTLIAIVDSLTAVKKLLKDLKANNIQIEQQKESAEPKEKGNGKLHVDSPEHRIELKADIQQGQLAKSTLIAFKNDIPELLKPSSLSVTDAVLILLLALETGLKKPQIDYESFKALYEAQNIKSGSPLAMKLTDLRNGGYIDKKVYKESKNLRLTGKGEKKALDLLRQLVS